MKLETTEQFKGQILDFVQAKRSKGSKTRAINECIAEIKDCLDCIEPQLERNMIAHYLGDVFTYGNVIRLKNYIQTLNEIKQTI